MGCILGLICGARGGDFEQPSHENEARVEETKTCWRARVKQKKLNKRTGLGELTLIS